jgi:hypothetical protein
MSPGTVIANGKPVPIAAPTSMEAFWRRWVFTLAAWWWSITAMRGTLNSRNARSARATARSSGRRGRMTGGAGQKTGSVCGSRGLPPRPGR